MELPDRRGIRCEYLPVISPKHNGVVERDIGMTLELAMASCLEAPRLALPSTGSFWAEACKYTCVVLHMARVRDKPDMHSPYWNVHGRAPFARLLSFLKPGVHHVKRTPKSDPEVEACLYTNGGNNHAQYFHLAACRTPATLRESTRENRL